MIKISEIKLPVNHADEALENKIKRILNLRHIENDMPDFSYKIIKRSIDARKNPEIFYTYSVAVTLPEKTEEKLLKKNAGKSSKISSYEPVIYSPLYDVKNKPDKAPVIVGEGPAGLFCGLILAYAGFKPVIIERGDSVENRIKAVNDFWSTGKLNKNTNVQYGEGGAGTFSDGKLNSGVKDARGLNQFVLDTFVKFGAEKECAYDSKPHVGTDKLAEIVKNIRNEIIDRGGHVFHLSKLTGLVIKNGALKGVNVESSALQDMNIKVFAGDVSEQSQAKCKTLECDDLILAIGHSARDTFRMLYQTKIPMQQKDFAVGLRIQHPQRLINQIQYGDNYGEIYGDALPPATYKLTNKTKDGRAVFSFCMCPGGYVVNASSHENMLCVNGMSNSKRDSENANSAIIVSVTKDDFPDDKNVFSGMEFQEELEKKAFLAGNGSIPIQKYGDYCKNTVTEGFDDVTISFKGKIKSANLRDVLPESINLSIIESMEKFGYTMKGFDDENAVLAGVESRTSSPVSILRDENMQSSIAGIYPCGEGAGYAGGIMSAAIDGIKVAEAVIYKYNHVEK